MSIRNRWPMTGRENRWSMARRPDRRRTVGHLPAYRRRRQECGGVGARAVTALRLVAGVVAAPATSSAACMAWAKPSLSSCRPP